MCPVKLNSKSLKSIQGKTLFEYADELSVRVPTSCQRNGECHECIVEIQKGFESLNPMTKPENILRGNYRLACQASLKINLLMLIFRYFVDNLKYLQKVNK